ncbi:DUF6477 family protein [Hansschlegelia zhihuaiae]|uniref:DUF6477 family protein n=1 Tax=Hansschlegelia zhihuaiae TaxID=405005 RepID=UPI001FE024E5|nr:DUF6477 family protein [Hansschlegelia zhihuaiae]
MRQAANVGLVGAVDGGREAYDRRRALPRLIAIDPRELEPGDVALDRVIEARLKRALRAERRRGRAGHWTYDLNRHIALLQALAGESRGSPGSAEARPSPVTPDHQSQTAKTMNAVRRTGRRS